MSDKKIGSCGSCAILIGIVIASVIVVSMFAAPRSGYLATNVSIRIDVPHSNTRTIAAKVRVPKAFLDKSDQVDGIAVVWCYEFQTSIPLFGKKTLKTFYKTDKIPLADFRDNIDQDGFLTIPMRSEIFSLFSRDGKDVHIVPGEWESSDPRGLHIERIGYFTRLAGKATVSIGTYHAESELSSTISADPLPEEYERQFVMSSLQEIVLPNFFR